MVSVSPNHQHYHHQHTSVTPSRIGDVDGSFTTTTTSTESPLEIEYKQLKRKMKEITDVIKRASAKQLNFATKNHCFFLDKCCYEQGLYSCKKENSYPHI